MDSLPLGCSGVRTTRLGFGLAAIGRPAYITMGRASDLPRSRDPEQLQERAHQLLDEAYRHGVRYFDAARSYGLAEDYLASWIDTRQPLPDPVICGSKWGYTYVGGWQLSTAAHELKDHSLAALRRQYRESAAILGERLQLYQVHSATMESGVLEDAMVLEELARLAEKGLSVGITVSGPRQEEVIRRALEVQVDGRCPFSTVQATWNLLEPSVGPALKAAQEAGWGTLVKEALANGRLLQGQDPRLAPIADLARDRGVSMDAICLGAALAQPFVDTVLLGAVTTGQLVSNVGATGVRLTPEELGRLQTISRSPHDYWSERATFPWQ